MAYYKEKNGKSFNRQPRKMVSVPYKRFQLLNINRENLGGFGLAVTYERWLHMEVQLFNISTRSKMTRRGNIDCNLKTKPMPGGYIHMYW